MNSSEIYLELDKEVQKARKAYEKAKRMFDMLPYEYGGNPWSKYYYSIAQIKEVQYQAARNMAQEFFDNHIA